MQFFSTPGLDTDGSAEGGTLIGTGTVTVVGTSASFTMNLLSGFVPGNYITATATGLGRPREHSKFTAGTWSAGVVNRVKPPTITATAFPLSVPAGQDVTDTFTITNNSVHGRRRRA